MNSVTFDLDVKNKRLQQINGKVKSAIDEDTSEFYYWCSGCHDWKKGNYQIEIIDNGERRGNKYSCMYCSTELFFEREKRIYHGM